MLGMLLEAAVSGNCYGGDTGHHDLYFIQCPSGRHRGRGRAAASCNRAVSERVCCIRHFYACGFLAALAGLFLYIFKKKSRKYEMPFVPFLFLAFLSEILLERAFG